MRRHSCLAAALLGCVLLTTAAPAAPAYDRGTVAPAAQTIAPAAQAMDAPVTIDNFTFSPAQLTVSPGTRVTWTNRDDIPHTVTDRDNPKMMKSAPLDTGESFAFTFDRPGTYHYFCSLHPHMQGTVVVR